VTAHRRRIILVRTVDRAPPTRRMPGKSESPYSRLFRDPARVWLACGAGRLAAGVPDRNLRVTSPHGRLCVHPRGPCRPAAVLTSHRRAGLRLRIVAGALRRTDSLQRQGEAAASEIPPRRHSTHGNLEAHGTLIERRAFKAGIPIASRQPVQRAGVAGAALHARVRVRLSLLGRDEADEAEGAIPPTRSVTENSNCKRLMRAPLPAHAAASRERNPYRLSKGPASTDDERSCLPITLPYNAPLRRESQRPSRCNDRSSPAGLEGLPPNLPVEADAPG